MTRRKRGGKGDTFDRQTLWLMVIIFLVGITVGFYFGKRSTEIQKVPEKKVYQEKQKPLSIPFFPATPQKKTAKIAIIIDDIGYNNHARELLWSLGQPVTLAILPGLAYSKYYAEEGQRRGFEIILHQPMEPVHRFGKEDVGIIRTAMTDAEIILTLEKNLRDVPAAVGINNHMGSLATQDRRVMRVIFQQLKNRNLFFLDSLTTPLTVARQEARSAGVPYIARDIFLDNELEVDYVHGQIEQLAQIARKYGSAIGICHYKSKTLSLLKEELARLRGEGFEIVPLKQLL